MNSLESTTNKLKEYLDLTAEIADKELAKLRSKAEKRYKDTKKRLDIVLENGELFKEDINDDSSAMDKYSNKIYEKVSSTIASIEKPEKFSLRYLEEFASGSRSALLAQDEILIKYVKLLKGSKYKKRVKFLSKSLQKLNKELTKFERFVSDDYAPNDDIERTNELISETIELLGKYHEKLDELFSFEEPILEKDKEISKIEEELQKIENHQAKKDYSAALQNYQETQKEVDYYFSNIRKAMRKYENIKSKMKNKPDMTLLKEFIKDAENCLAKQNSIASLESLMREILNELENSNLRLKRDKREATIIDIKKLLNGELKSYWKRSKDSVENKNSTSQKLEELHLYEEEAKIKNAIDAAKRDRNRLIERELRLINGLNDEIIKSIGEINSKLISNYEEFSKIVVEFPELPSWSKIKS